MEQQSSVNNIPQQPKVTCPGCTEDIVYYDGNSSYFVCHKCKAFFRQETSSRTQSIGGFSYNLEATPSMPVGSEGVLEDITFTVVGFMKKATHDAVWKEYLLYNADTAQYNILAEYNGHWTLFSKTDFKDFELFKKGAYYNPEYGIKDRNTNRKFRHYMTYTFDVKWAAGEFDWNIIDGAKHLEIAEYVNGPDMLVSEKTNNNTEWYKGKHITVQDVCTAFGKSRRELPWKVGPGILEQPAYEHYWVPLLKFTILLTGLIILTHMFLGIFKPGKDAYAATYVTSKDTTSWATLNPIVSESFEIEQTGAISLDIITDVDNDWLEISLALVNNKTGETYEVTKAFEYYHGYESGEGWSEGSRGDEAIFSNVPKGQYHLNIYPYSESKIPFNIGVTVEERTTLYSNLVWMLLAILLVPGIIYTMKKTRESYFWE